MLEHLDHLVAARVKNIKRAFRKGDPRMKEELDKVMKDKQQAKKMIYESPMGDKERNLVDEYNHKHKIGE